jgi:hypothetical protein
VIQYLNYYRKEETRGKPIPGFGPTSVVPASGSSPARP